MHLGSATWRASNGAWRRETCRGGENDLIRYDWSGLTSSESSALCPTTTTNGQETSAFVSSCPTTGAVGACTYTVSDGSAGTYTCDSTDYSAGRETCATAQSACTEAGSESTAIKTTFKGDGC